MYALRGCTFTVNKVLGTDISEGEGGSQIVRRQRANEDFNPGEDDRPVAASLQPEARQLQQQVSCHARART